MKAEDKIEWSLIVLILICVLGYLAAHGQSTNPVSAVMVSPTNGQTVSGTIPVSVQASSTMGPIKHIEFYRDQTMIANVYYSQPPQNVSIAVK